MIALSFPDSTYTQASKPSVETLKGDLQLIEEAVNASVTVSSTDTLTNKTLTTPIISSISNTGTITIPTQTGTLLINTSTAGVGTKAVLAVIVFAVIKPVVRRLVVVSKVKSASPSSVPSPVQTPT